MILKRIYHRKGKYYYDDIKNRLLNNKVYSEERYKTTTYFEIVKLLNEDGGKYKENIIDEYSKRLEIKVGKKYNRSTLFRM